MKKSIIRIFFMVFVLCTVVGCLSGCNTNEPIVPGSTELNVTEDNVLPCVTLNGVLLEEYEVVYAKTDTRFESKVAEQIRWDQVEGEERRYRDFAKSDRRWQSREGGDHQRDGVDRGG